MNPVASELPSSRRYISVSDDQSLAIATDKLPLPSEHEVLIQVHGIGINRGDLLQRKGLYPAPADASPILGLEVSGKIVATGNAVTRWKVGDRVCALTHGAGYCDYTVVPDHQCLPIPDNISTIEAAGLPEAVFTVWHNVFERCRLKAGENFLVHGGASGIGTLAIQMAKAAGAIVYASAGSDEKAAFCEQLGAQQGVNYNSEDFFAHLPAIDVILDMAGGDFIQKNIEHAAEDGRICSIAFVRGIKADINFASVLLKRLTLTASTLRAQSFARKAAMAQQIEQHIWPQIKTGEIKPIIDKTFVFEEVEAAHTYMQSGQHKGKILLSVSPP